MKARPREIPIVAKAQAADAALPSLPLQPDVASEADAALPSVLLKPDVGPPLPSLVSKVRKWRITRQRECLESMERIVNVIGSPHGWLLDVVRARPVLGPRPSFGGISRQPRLYPQTDGEWPLPEHGGREVGDSFLA